MLYFIIQGIPYQEVDSSYVPWLVLSLLVLAHFLGDFVFQTEYIAKNKDPANTSFGLASYMLFVHSFIHAGLILLLTASLKLSIIMLVTHFIIDILKVCKVINYFFDQALHFLVILVILLFYIDLITH